MRWKSLALTLLFVLTMAGQAAAVPASRALHTLSQPDGTTFQAMQWGDEYAHGWQTAEGQTILLDKETSTWHYAVPGTNGAVVASPAVVGKDLPPTLAGPLRPADVVAKAAARRAAVRQQRLATVPSSPAGTSNLLVALMQFPDYPATFARDKMYDVFFGNNPTGSVSDYYTEVSGGRFTVSDGGTGTQGWFTANKNHDYYGQNDPYNSNNTDIHVQDLIIEAATALNNIPGFDFSKYDSDGDCYVDAFAVIYAGTEESTSGNANDIWPHQYTLTYAAGAPFKTHTLCPGHANQYIMIDDYIAQGERSDDGKSSAIATIGTMAHEYGHVLGLPDLYDTDYTSNGVGDWSLMANGCYGGTPYGASPAHLDAWSKYFLGWITPVKVQATLNNRQIQPVENGGAVYQLLDGTPMSGEYYLVENRQRKGFDAGLLASGLIIWHIDGDMISNNFDTNTVDNNECYPGSNPSCLQQHYGVSLVQADGKYNLEKLDWDHFYESYGTGFPFPGTSGHKSFTDSTTPSAKLFSGASSNIQVTSITTGTGGAMSATLSSPSGGITPPVSNISPQAATVAAAGQDGITVAVTEPDGTAWSAASNASWIAVTSGTSGSGDGSVTISVAPNTGYSPRTGTVTIAGYTFTVTQNSTLPVVFTLTSAAMNPLKPLSYKKGSVKVSFSVSGTTTKADLIQLVGQMVQTSDWLHVATSGISVKTARAPYSFTVTVTATVDPNPASQSRTGTLTLADQTYTVYQDDAPCAVSAITLTDPKTTLPSKIFDSNGGNIIRVTVTAPSACNWAAASVSTWLSGLPVSGTATQTFTLSATPNVGSVVKGKYKKNGKRSTTVTIQTVAAKPAKKTCSVSQNGA